MINSDSLERKLTNLKENALRLKTKQLAGYDNSRIYKYVDAVEFTENITPSSYAAGHVLELEAESPFPLVSVTVKIYENGVYKPNPRYLNIIPPGETRSSLASYSLYDPVFLNGPPPSNYTQLMFYVYPDPNTTLTTRVVFTILSTSPLKNIKLTNF